ncbi:MAG: 30S ribosomal protein S6 [Patescibacteria group bacterium]|nr:30S ribosomal protein S6 [Patescibacteria group bacterium]
MRSSEVLPEELAVYEIGYLILPSIPEDKLSNITNAIRKVITTEGGTEIDAEAPFKETLAYTMSKTIGASRYVLSDAYLGWIKFEVDRAKAPTIKAGVEEIEEVLRFLLIKAPRETTFTFAKARAAVAPMPEEIGVPTYPIGLSEDVRKENVVKS